MTVVKFFDRIDFRTNLILISGYIPGENGIGSSGSCANIFIETSARDVAETVLPSIVERYGKTYPYIIVMTGKKEYGNMQKLLKGEIPKGYLEKSREEYFN